MDQICVSVFMLTYNQEEFIAQAIEGVLMQKTNFSIQLVIGEDCSTDATRKICKTYAERFPEKIKLLLNDKNIGIGANYVKTYAQCTGKYVAICDGDDYWIDPLKLQKQVDFLENNIEFSIIYTNNFNLFPSGEKTGPKNDGRASTTSFNDLVIENYMTSVTVLFKNTPLTNRMKTWMPHFPYGDWPTYLLVTGAGGKIYFLNEPTVVYRKDFGTSTILREEKSKLGQINLAILQNINKDGAFTNRKESIKESILKLKTGLMASYNKEARFLKALLLMSELFLKKKSFHIIPLYLYSLKRRNK